MVILAACSNEPLIDDTDLKAAVRELSDEFEKAEQRAEQRAEARRASAARPTPTNSKLPPGAAKTIAQARAAIAARDLRKLETLLDDFDGIASFEIGSDLEAKTVKAAIKGWRANPSLLDRLDEALAAPCDVGAPDEDGQILISCGEQESSVAYVVLANLERSRRTFKIYAFGMTR